MREQIRVEYESSRIKPSSNMGWLEFCLNPKWPLQVWARAHSNWLKMSLGVIGKINSIPNRINNMASRMNSIINKMTSIVKGRFKLNYQIETPTWIQFESSCTPIRAQLAQFKSTPKTKREWMGLQHFFIYLLLFFPFLLPYTS